MHSRFFGAFLFVPAAEQTFPNDGLFYWVADEESGQRSQHCLKRAGYKMK